MTTDLISSFNFVDIIMGLIIVRCIYSGATAGLVIEFFKLVGMFFATFITLHYFSVFAEFLNKFILIPMNLSELVAFVFLWAIVILIFKIIRDGWMLILKTEAQEAFNQWGGAVTGIFRGILVCGLATAVLFLSDQSYLIKSAKNSFSGFYLKGFSAGVYETTFDGFVNKLFPSEKKNRGALTIEDRNLIHKDKKKAK